MIKQNKFISIISIAGTALAIMMIMAILVTDEVKNVNVTPENNRDRTLHIKYFYKEGKKDKSGYYGPVVYSDFKEYLQHLKTPEAISLNSISWRFKPTAVVTVDGSNEVHMALNRQTDAAYFNIISLSFIEGKPFTHEEAESGIRNVVITENMAKKLYKGESALGKTISIDYIPYKVTGIVKDVSRIFEYAYSDLWIPYKSVDGFDNRTGYSLLILAKNKNDFDKIENEVRAIEQKRTNADEEWKYAYRGPYNHQIQGLNPGSNEEPDMKKFTRKRILILTILLLIPAINLSSFSLSRINKRIEEIGVRKAFGAKKYSILIQVLYENLITSLIGGIIGLILSYIVVIWLKQWLFGLNSDTFIPVSTLISVWIFVAVFVICVILNLLSAGIPAFRAAKMNIVDSLNSKRK